MPLLSRLHENLNSFPWRKKNVIPSRYILVICITLCIFSCFGPSSSFAEGPKIIISEGEYDFGQCWQGDKIIHTFRLKNVGDGEFTIEDQKMVGPFTSARFKRSLPPGQEMDVILTVDTSQLKGAVETGIILHTNSQDSPRIELRIRGQVNPMITIRPSGALFFSAYKGETPEKSLDIINNYEQPLDIKSIESSSERFTYRLQTVKKGREYRLSVRLNPKASPGRTMEQVTLLTNSEKTPQLSVGVNIFIKNDVYTFPDDVDFGTITMEEIRKNPQIVDLLTQTVLVKRREGKGKDFQIKLEQNIPFILIKKEPESGSEVYRLDVSLVPEKMMRGKIATFIRVLANDKDVPEIRIPVRGEIR